MLSYRHAFHAGNFADVLKHVVLIRLLAWLVRKEAPLLYLDTHAGAGEYDLRSAQAGQTGEFRDGIGRLWQATGLPSPLEEYVGLVRAFNGDGELRRYPGSPRIAQRMLRRQDRLELCELHTSDFATLEDLFRGDRRVRCHADDGFRVAMARLPPRERRGLVFIDPSYEVKDDYQRAIDALCAMNRRFATGVYALWYPMVDRRSTESLKSALEASGLRDVLEIELSLDTPGRTRGMTGCGLFVVNPPWTLATEMKAALDELTRRLAGPRPAHGSVRQFLPE